MTHLYTQFENTDTWNALDGAITELVQDSDLIEQTARPYIVGYLCKALSEKGGA